MWPIISRRWRLACCALAVLGASGLTSDACTVCAGENAAEVRTALAGDDSFAVNLAAAALPSLVCFGIVAAVHFGFPARRGRPGPWAREVQR